MRKAGRGTRTWFVVAIAAAAVMTYMLATTFAGSATGATTAATTTWVTVSGAGFQHEDGSDNDYDHNGYSGKIVDDDGNEYVADVTLPHGSTVLGVWAFFDDPDDEGANLHLEESDNDGDHTDIANISMSDCQADDDGEQCVATDNHLDSPDVDNAHRSYGLWLSTNCEEGCEFGLYRVAIKVGGSDRNGRGYQLATRTGHHRRVIARRTD